MNSHERDLGLFDIFSPRRLNVLIRLAAGLNISQISRQLGMSRSTIHRWLRDENFRLDLLFEMRNFISIGLVAHHCLAYRRKVLKAVIRTFSKVDNSQKLLKQFEENLDRFDKNSGLDTRIIKSSELFCHLQSEWDARKDQASLSALRRQYQDRIHEGRKPSLQDIDEQIKLMKNVMKMQKTQKREKANEEEEIDINENESRETTTDRKDYYDDIPF